MIKRIDQIDKEEEMIDDEVEISEEELIETASYISGLGYEELIEQKRVEKKERDDALEKSANGRPKIKTKKN